MIRIDLDAQALSNTRFVVSPLQVVTDSLWLLHPSAQSNGRGWSALVRQTVRDRRLVLLGALFTGTWKYTPDFIRPQPEAHVESLERELHAIAAVSPERLTHEIALMLDGNATLGIPGGSAPHGLLRALDRGESEFAERVAAELHQLWQTTIGAHWPALRSRIEGDIAQRALTSAQHGLASMLAGLHPRVMWSDDHLRLVTDFRGRICGATSLDLTPSVFNSDLHMMLDPLPGPGQRQPMLVYPTHPGPRSESTRLRPTYDLIGVTRARILSDLETPRTTTELAERHWLAASTISYHLRVLHRSGLLIRTRASRRVLYQQSPRAVDFL